MKIHRYSRWDGSQEAFSLDADEALDALADHMMHGLTAEQALQHMRQYGFELAGRDFRVMGLGELLHELQQRARELSEQYRLDEATRDMQQRLEELLDAEQQTLREQSGFESQAMNDFMQRRHGEHKRLSDAIARFQDYEFQNAEAAEQYELLKQELDELRALEDFIGKMGESFDGPQAADYETAQDIRRRMEGMQQAADALREGRLGDLDPGQLAEALGNDASQSLIILRDLEAAMRDEGYLRDDAKGNELTPRAVRRIGAQALAEVYRMLRKGKPGGHETHAHGAAMLRPDESRPYEFGDSLNIDIRRSIMNTLRRSGTGTVIDSTGDAGQPRPRLKLAVDDLEVAEMDHATETTTVLLLDLSWSMSFDGRFPAAKRVALAMDQLIRTRFPRDHFFIVGFATRARELQVRELPEVSWDAGEPFTNLQEGLMVAERLISRHPASSPQILVITDGQPTAYFADGELHVEWPSGYGGISPRAVAETLKQVKRVTQRGITINTFMLHDSPELVGFVERMTEINHGRALFTDPAQLGSYVLVDRLGRR